MTSVLLLVMLELVAQAAYQHGRSWCSPSHKGPDKLLKPGTQSNLLRSNPARDQDFPCEQDSELQVCIATSLTS
jgi:hypothetical protein